MLRKLKKCKRPRLRYIMYELTNVWINIRLLVNMRKILY